MKQDIYCPRCAAELRRKYRMEEGDTGKKEPYLCERLRIVDGTARAFFNCDLCFFPIPEGAKCAAVSMWTHYAPYREWEHRYLKTTSRTDPQSMWIGQQRKTR